MSTSRHMPMPRTVRTFLYGAVPDDEPATEEPPTMSERAATEYGAAAAAGGLCV